MTFEDLHSMIAQSNNGTATNTNLRKLQSTSNGSRLPKTKSIVDTSFTGGDERTSWPLGSFQQRPVLSKFSFDYLSGDRNFERLRLQPDESGVSVTMQDRTRNDPYRWKVTGVEVPPGTLLGTVNRDDQTGCTTVNIQKVRGKVALLQGFDVRFNNDRNIDKLGVSVFDSATTSRPSVVVCLADVNSDDRYSFEVSYALVDESAIVDIASARRANDRGGLDDSVPLDIPPNTVPVIGGFAFDFARADRNFDKAQVDLNQDGRINMIFADTNNDDPYRWSVMYAFMSIQ